MKNPKRAGLKACPFDGGKAGLTDLGARVAHLPWRVRCFTCNASTTFFSIQSLAVTAWNRRKELPKIQMVNLPKRGGLRDLYNGLLELEEMEVPKEDWKHADKLVSLGLAKYESGARGPGKMWKRVALVPS